MKLLKVCLFLQTAMSHICSLVSKDVGAELMTIWEVGLLFIIVKPITGDHSREGQKCDA